jgi:hypothetical protein
MPVLHFTGRDPGSGLGCAVLCLDWFCWAAMTGEVKAVALE